QSRRFRRSDENAGADHRPDHDHGGVDRPKRAHQATLLLLVAHSRNYGARRLTSSSSRRDFSTRAKSTATGVSPWTQTVSARTSTSAPSTDLTLPSRSIRTTRAAASFGSCSKASDRVRGTSDPSLK